MSFLSQRDTYASSSSYSNTQQEAVYHERSHRGLVISKPLIISFLSAPADISSQHGLVQHSCSDEFLVFLCIEFCKAQSHKLISRLRDLEPAEQDQRLKFLAYEIKRLLQQPQLFPSETSTIRFLSFLAADLRLQLCEAISSLLMQNEV
jgi:hypothetical protein